MTKGLILLNVKKRYLLCLTAIAMVLMGNSQADKDGIKLQNMPENSQLKMMLHVTSAQELYQIIILPTSSFNQEEAAKMISRIDRLPTSLLEKLHHHGVVIKFFSGKLTDNPTAAHLSGKIPRGYTRNRTWDDVPGIGGGKTVLVKIGHSDKGKGHSSVNLELHELAHSIDRHVYDNLRYHESFLNIWHLEKAKMFPNNNYFLTYPEEYFAETFAYYFLGGVYHDQLKEKAPLTYQLIQSLN